MVDQSIVLDIWKLTKHDVSKSDVEQILIEYEKRKVPEVKSPQDNLLRAGEVYAANFDNGDDSETFTTFKALTEYLEETILECDWDYYDFASKATVYIRRDADLKFDITKKCVVTLK